MTNSLCTKTFFKFNSSMLSLYDSAKKTKKDVTEKEAKKENEDEANETPQKHKRVLKGAYKNFVLPGLSKNDIDGYVDQVKMQVKALIGI